MEQLSQQLPGKTRAATTDESGSSTLPNTPKRGLIHDAEGVHTDSYHGRENLQLVWPDRQIRTVSTGLKSLALQQANVVFCPGSDSA